MQLQVTQGHLYNRRDVLRMAAISSMLAASSHRIAPAWAGDAGSITQNDLIVHSDYPRNAEPALDHLANAWLTPLEYFYVRNHGSAPSIDPSLYRLSVDGLVERPQSFSLEQLGQFRSMSVVATMTCAGNRRSELSRLKRVEGVQWNAGAIGNAKWSGTRLSDILKACGIQDHARHIWFEGLDEVGKGGETIHFGGSIPIEKGLHDTEQMPGVLVATRMNDQPLLREHGFPVRTVVPGYIGARSVKWLGKIVVSDRPSPNHYVASAYRIVQQDSDLAWAEAGPIYTFPINSAICSPQPGAQLRPGDVTLQGYALAHGAPGTFIDRVQVSADDGRNWVDARLLPPSQEYCWRLWQANLLVDATTRQFIVRAVDSDQVMQPRDAGWNLKGYLYNGWHQVPVEVRE